MTIAIDARMYGPERWTGVGRYLQQLIRHLEDIDQENYYIILLNRENYDLYQPSNPHFRKMLAPYRIYSFAEQLSFAFFLYRLKVDLVHFAAPNAPILYFRPHVTTIHDMTLVFYNTSKATGVKAIISSVKRLVFRFALRSMASSSRLILTPTNYIKHQLVAYYHLSERKVVATRLGVSVNHISPEPVSRLNISGKYLLYVGNCYPYKNVPALVTAFARISTVFPALTLVLVGRDDFFRNKIRAQVSSENVSSRVVFTGAVSDGELATLYRHAELYVYPSLSEGFGLQGLEAMAFGAPVLAANASCLPETCGEAAAYFNPSDPADLTEQLTTLLNDQDHREKLKALGFEHIKSFSWATMADTTLKAYAQAVAHR